MKIASLSGYSPVSKSNQKNELPKTQKIPAFNGTITLIADDLNIAPKFKDIVTRIKDFLTIKSDCKIETQDLSQGSKGIETFTFLDTLNKDVKTWVTDWNNRFTTNKDNLIVVFNN